MEYLTVVPSCFGGEDNVSKWYQSETGAVLKELGTDASTGLTGAEASIRLNRHGPNELVDRGQKSPWAILWDQLTELMVVILIVAAVASALLGDFKDAVAILTIVIETPRDFQWCLRNDIFQWITCNRYFF